MSTRALCDAYCKAQRMFDAPITHHSLAVLYREVSEFPPPWEHCLAVAAITIKRWMADEDTEIRAAYKATCATV